MSQASTNTEARQSDNYHPTIMVEVTHGPATGELRYLEFGAPFVVGRSPKAELCIKSDPHLSRQHFRIVYDKDGCFLVDLGSQNGTLLGRRRVADRAELSDGTVLEAGASQFLIRIQEPGPEIQKDVRFGESKICCSECGQDVVLQRASVLAEQSETSTGFTADFRCRECRLTFESGQLIPFPGYDVIKQLASGSMGTIYLVQSQYEEQQFALKILRPDAQLDETGVRRFLREAASLQALAHRNIVKYEDQGYLDGDFFFVMEYVHGVDLDVYRRQAGGKIPIQRCTQMMTQVLDGLEYAHRQGFIHRDVKPANILVGVLDGQITPKLTDFGLAKRYENIAVDPVTRGHIAFGTPDYMPPEQVTRFKDSDPRGDIYAVGASMYHLLCGKTLFDGLKGRDPIRLLLETEPPRLNERDPTIPNPIVEAVHKALCRNPDDRWNSAAEFRDQLLLAI